jgi:hypothetical protein
MNADKIILDLCGGTGAWSRPYKDAGYDVRLITLPDNDVRTYQSPKNVYGILAAPECTDFSVSGAQYWMLKDIDGRTIDSMGLVIACLRVIAQSQPSFWALENPVGRLSRWMGKYQLSFNPCDYGDAYTKRTYLWGIFNMPQTNPVNPVKVCSEGSWLMQLGGKSTRTKELRSITPPGFAKAFFEANQ